MFGSYQKTFAFICLWTACLTTGWAHRDHKHIPPESSPAAVAVPNIQVPIDESTFGYYYQLFVSLIHDAPTPAQDDLIAHLREITPAMLEAPGPQELANRLEACYLRARADYQVRHVRWDGSQLTLVDQIPLRIYRSLMGRVLVEVTNSTSSTLELTACFAATPEVPSPATTIPPGQTRALPTALTLLEAPATGTTAFNFSGNAKDDSIQGALELPIQLIEPVTLRGTLLDSETGEVWPGRVYARGSDMAYRHGKAYADILTVSQKPLIQPREKYALPFFYSDGTFEIDLPPGRTELTLERGFEHETIHKTIVLTPGQDQEVTLASRRLIDMKKLGWISGDTHIHWVKNHWSENEDLDLLRVVQRAEDIRVVNNLTLLHRTANKAFIAPSHYPMGPVPGMCDDEYHVQMAEEYRNEEFYGHLCFLNIYRLILPISTGRKLAGPDAPDYPINKTAILDCRSQGGISIEAHSLGLNWDVPVNVVHGLTDSLDQMNPDDYYRFLDCGFHLPLTNGSDHPARLAGSARAYVKVDGDFTYEKWIDGIRQCRTFTTSGPLLFLSVTDDASGRTAEIGETLDVTPGSTLTLDARAFSREWIGNFQLMVNGEIVGQMTNVQNDANLSIKLEANEPMWVIARCSPTQNYSAVAVPDTAHTSAIYIDMDGHGVFVPVAARFWADRMCEHAADIAANGNFAFDYQRDEAVGYVEDGVKMFEAMIEKYSSIDK